MNWWDGLISGSAVGLTMWVSAILVIWGLKNKVAITIVAAVLLMAGAQYQTSVKRSLTDLTGDEQRVVELRKSAYPPITWMPIAYWLEEKPVTVAVKRWSESLFENLDLNQYFFAGHPRERVGHIEVEKLPYLLMPLALLGLWRLAREKSGQVLLISTGLALMALAIVGNQNPNGTVAAWPMWVGAIYLSLWRKK